MTLQAVTSRRRAQTHIEPEKTAGWLLTMRANERGMPILSKTSEQMNKFKVSKRMPINLCQEPRSSWPTSSRFSVGCYFVWYLLTFMFLSFSVPCLVSHELSSSTCCFRVLGQVRHKRPAKLQSGSGYLKADHSVFASAALLCLAPDMKRIAICPHGLHLCSS